MFVRKAFTLQSLRIHKIHTASTVFESWTRQVSTSVSGSPPPLPSLCFCRANTFPNTTTPTLCNLFALVVSADVSVYSNRPYAAITSAGVVLHARKQRPPRRIGGGSSGGSVPAGKIPGEDEEFVPYESYVTAARLTARLSTLSLFRRFKLQRCMRAWVSFVHAQHREHTSRVLLVRVLKRSSSKRWRGGGVCWRVCVCVCWSVCLLAGE